MSDFYKTFVVLIIGFALLKADQTDLLEVSLEVAHDAVSKQNELKHPCNQYQDLLRLTATSNPSMWDAPEL